MEYFLAFGVFLIQNKSEGREKKKPAMIGRRKSVGGERRRSSFVIDLQSWI